MNYRNPVHHMNPDDIEGEEAGDSFVIAEEEIKFTPFNMKVSFKKHPKHPEIIC